MKELKVDSRYLRPFSSIKNKLSDKELKFFKENGFVLCKGLLSSDHLEPLVYEFAEVLDQLYTKLYKEKKVISAEFYERTKYLPFEERYRALIEETGQVYIEYFRPSLPNEIKTISPETPMHFGPEVFKLLTNNKVLNCIEQIFGHGEIYCNPIQNFRIKPPNRVLPKNINLIKDDGAGAADNEIASCNGYSNSKTIDKASSTAIISEGDVNGAKSLNDKKNVRRLPAGLVGTTPWHQDNAVCTEDSDNTQMVTAWIPLHDVPIDNGTLLIAPKTQKLGLLGHCVQKENREVTLSLKQVLEAAGNVKKYNVNDDTNLGTPWKHCPQGLKADGVFALEFEKGDVVFLDKRVVHASDTNRTNDFRFSADFRYNKVGEPNGRDILPGFVVRTNNPDIAEREKMSGGNGGRRMLLMNEKLSKTEILKMAAKWKKMWMDKRTELSTMNDSTEYTGRDRWTKNLENPVYCA